MSTTFLLAVGLDWWQLENHMAAWKSEGYFVISTDSIKEAISHFKDADFDLVLLGQSINHEDKERLTFLIRSTGTHAPVVCNADSSGSSASFADATLKDESSTLLTGMNELLAKKAKLRSASAVLYGTAI
jgi:DNA-binding NtrC family response regulator